MKPSKPIKSSGRRNSSRRKRQTVGELVALQRLMATAVMRPLVGRSETNPLWTDNSKADRVIAGFIKPNERLTSFERLQLYNRQYWFRLLDCFSEDYPGLRAVLGDRRFNRLAERYLAECPSTSFTMRNLGRSLVGFIEQHPELVAPKVRLANDMARLEWAHIEAFDNAAKPFLTAADLVAANPCRLRLRLQPYLTLLHLNHSLENFLVAVRRRQKTRDQTSNATKNPHLLSPARLPAVVQLKSVHLAVHRHQNSVFYKRLKPEQFFLLNALQSGLSLEMAIERMLETHATRSVLPKQLTIWFETWSALGWFCNPTQSNRSHHF